MWGGRGWGSEGRRDLMEMGEGVQGDPKHPWVVVGGSCGIHGGGMEIHGGGGGGRVGGPMGRDLEL